MIEAAFEATGTRRTMRPAIARPANLLLACLATAVTATVALAASAARDAPAVPATMKAVSFSQYGDSSVLQYADVPVPKPAAGEVLVRVQAASVNPADWKRRAGSHGPGSPPAPIIPGFDVSGTVVAVGPDVSAFKVNDAVYGIVALGKSGGYAQYALAPATQIVRKPPALDHAHAAAIPLAALTAWQALFDAAKLQSGQTVVIQGGAGGVGHFAVQMAKAKGARVIATASAENQEFLRLLGADQVIDYRAVQFDRVLKNVDVVFDTVGGDTLRRSYGILRKGGYLVGIVDPVDAQELASHGISGSHIVVKPDARELDEINDWIAAGKMRADVSRTFPLAEAAAAQNLSEAGHTRGKIVLIP
jgi:NADPH:quinone reductase-like Zn-dependent oxidoreductase